MCVYMWSGGFIVVVVGTVLLSSICLLLKIKEKQPQNNLVLFPI